MDIKVRAGTVNHGIVYESKIITVLASKLAKNETISDFWIVQSPEGLGIFDDIVLIVDYDKGVSKAFLIQVKHKETKTLKINLKECEDSYKIVRDFLAKKEGVLEKKLNSVDFDNYYFCFFTNGPVNNLDLDEKKADETIAFIDIGGRCRYSKVQHKGKREEDFINKFYIFTEQPNNEQIVENIIEPGFTGSMVYHLWNKIAGHLVHPVENGYNTRPLTKDVFTAKCMEVILCQQISAHMTATNDIDENYFPIWQMIFSNRFILIHKNELENLLPLIAKYYEKMISEFLKKQEDVVTNFNWSSCFQDMFRLDNSVRTALGRVGRNMFNLGDLLLYMWRKEKLPLPINSTFAETFRRFSINEAHHFIVITYDNNSPHGIIETVSDFGGNDQIVNIEVSLQGRNRAALKRITGENADVLKSITVSNILLWTAKNGDKLRQRQIGKSLNVVGKHYISRTFHREGWNNEETEKSIIGDYNNKFTIISNEAGMGKSTVLRSLARKYNNECYVIFCNLSDCVKDLKKIANSYSDPVQYFYEKMETKPTKITDAIYKYHKQSGKLALFMDSYDEILPKHETTVLKIIENILSQNINLYITLRVQAENKLTSKFNNARLLKLTALTDKNIKDYCKKMNIPEADSDYYDFLRIPLHLKMYADYYEQTENRELNKTHLYQHFISRKIKEFYKIRKIEDHVQALVSDFEDSTMEHHYRMALVLLFGLDLLEELDIFRSGDWYKTVEAFQEYKLSLGIVTGIDPVKFLHRTFAEYLAAKYLAMHPNKSLYLKITTDKSLPVIYEFLYNIRSDIAGELPRAILDANIETIKDNLFINKDTLGKEREALYPVQWASISCYMNRNDHTKLDESFQVLNHIVQAIKSSKFLHYEIDKRDSILNWTWLNYLTGYEDETYFHNRELIRYFLNKIVPESLKEVIHSKINMTFSDNDCNLFDLVCRDKEINHEFERFQKLLGNLRKSSNVDAFGRNILHHACYGGKLNFVKELLSDSDLMKNDRKGQNCFHHACAGGNNDVVQYLLDHLNEASIKSVDNEGRNAFLHACSGGNLQIVQLLEHRLEIIEDKHEQNALHYACKMGQVDVAKHLISTLNFDVEKKSSYGKTALHYACFSTNINLFDLLENAELNAKDREGLTPLHFACSKGNRDFVIKLLQTNVNVIEEVDHKGLNALHHACRGKNLDMVKDLLDIGLKPTERDNDGLSIIHHACAGGNLQIAKYILNTTAGRNPLVADGRRKSGLHNACAEGHTEVTKLLIEKDFDPKLPDENGETPLHYAAMHGHVDVIEILLSKHADPNAGNKQGVTPLHVACRNGHEKAVKMILYANGNPRCCDNRGWNALCHAYCDDNEEIIQILLTLGLNPYEKTTQGYTPIELSRKKHLI